MVTDTGLPVGAEHRACRGQFFEELVRKKESGWLGTALPGFANHGHWQGHNLENVNSATSTLA